MNTLLLAINTWDLVSDASGNIAMATDPYAVAQDVASQCRLFLGELWYDTSQGIPYFERVLGKMPSAQYVKSQLEGAALLVPEVASAQCFITRFVGRVLTAQLQLTLTSGTTVIIGTSDVLGAIPWYVSAVSAQAAA